MKTFIVLNLCLTSVLALDKAHHQHMSLRKKHRDEPDVSMSPMEATVKEAFETSSGAPTVVDTKYCASVLVKISKHEAPFWDEEGLDGSGCCNEDRADLLAGCEKKLDGFMDKIAELCPSVEPESDNDFKAVKYVEDVENVKTASQHKKPPKPVPECPDPCEDECECCCDNEEPKELKRTKDGKPVDAWADHPLPPSDTVDAMAKAAEDEEGCDSPPCSAEDFESFGAPKDVQEVAAGSSGVSDEAEVEDEVEEPAPAADGE